MTEFDTGTWILTNVTGTVTDQSCLAQLRYGEAVGCPCWELVRAVTRHGEPHCTPDCFADLPGQAIRSRVVVVDGERVRLTCARGVEGLTIQVDNQYWHDGPPLSDDEREVLEGVSAGLTPGQIAGILSIPVREVHHALSTAQQKLEADSILQAAVRAVLSGQITVLRK